MLLLSDWMKGSRSKWARRPVSRRMRWTLALRDVCERQRRRRRKKTPARTYVDVVGVDVVRVGVSQERVELDSVAVV